MNVELRKLIKRLKYLDMWLYWQVNHMKMLCVESDQEIKNIKWRHYLNITILYIVDVDLHHMNVFVLQEQEEQHYIILRMIKQLKINN